MDDRSSNLPPRPWYRSYYAVFGLFLFVLSMGVIGGVVTRYVLAVAINECAEETKTSIRRIEREPASTEEELLVLRETFEDCPDTYTAGSYFLAQPVPSGQYLEWYALVCYLHDRGDRRATARLEALRIQTEDGRQSLLSWLQARTDDELEPLYRKHMDEFEIHRDADNADYIDATSIEN